MTRSLRAINPSHRALIAVPVLAAAITALAVAPAAAQQEQYRFYPAPYGSVGTTVLVTPGPVASAVVVAPAAQPTEVIPPAPPSDTTASVIIAPNPPAAATVAVVPAQPTTTVVTTASSGQPASVIAVPTTPPAAEIISPQVAVANAMDWQPGHWEYTGYSRTYIPGQYVPRPQGGSYWVPGRWQQLSSDEPYTWVAGHWG